MLAENVWEKLRLIVVLSIFCVSVYCASTDVSISFGSFKLASTGQNKNQNYLK